MAADRAFRITAWISLPPQLNSLKFRRAMTALSVGAASPATLELEAGLSRDDLRLLLTVLDRAGVLAVSSGANRRAVDVPSHKATEAMPASNRRVEAPESQRDRNVTEQFFGGESTPRWMRSFAVRHARLAGPGAGNEPSISLYK